MQTTLTPREAYNNVETEQEMIEWLKATSDVMLVELDESPEFKWDSAAPGSFSDRSTALAQRIDYQGLGLECLSKMWARMVHELAARPDADLDALHSHLFSRWH